MTTYTEHVSCKITEERYRWLEDQATVRDKDRSQIIRQSMRVAEEAGLDYSGEGDEKYSAEHVRELKREIESLKLENDRLESKVGDKQEMIRQLQEELDAREAELGDDLEQLSRSVTQFDRRVGEMTREFKSEVETLDETVSEQANSFGDLQTQLSKLKSSVDQLRVRIEDDIEDRDERDLNFSGIIDQLNEQLGNMDARLAAIQQDLDAESVSSDDDGGGLFR